MLGEKFKQLKLPDIPIAMPLYIRRRYERYLIEEERRITAELEAFYRIYGLKNVLTYSDLIQKVQKNLSDEDVAEINKKVPLAILAIHRRKRYITRIGYLLADIKLIKDIYSKKLNALVSHSFKFYNIPKDIQKDILKDTMFFFANRGRRETAQIAKYIMDAAKRGQSYKTVASQLHKQFRMNKKKAQTLYRTESSKIQTYVHVETLKEHDYKSYRYIAHPGCCKYCAALNGKIIQIKNIEKNNMRAKNTADMCGNIPPLHPNCRCTIEAPI